MESNSTANKLLRSEKYSDLTILCQGHEFKVHKAIICPQSEMISKMCDADMQERSTGIIEHKEFDADTVERMIDFAYEKSYEVNHNPRFEPAEKIEDSIASLGSSAIEDASTIGGVTLYQNSDGAPILDNAPAELSTTEKMVIHTRVYGVADYYDMPELRDHACRCFMNVASYELEDADLKGFDNVAREVCKTTVREDGSARNPLKSPLHTGFFSLVTLYAPKLAPGSDFTVALCEPGLQDSAADIFCVLAKRIAELEVEKDVKTSTLEAEKAALQQDVAKTKAEADSKISTAEGARQAAEERVQRSEGVVHRLLKSLRNLPLSCANSWCSNEFGRLKFARNGNGDWQVRCEAKKCRCKLN
ncbi:hypothetical protein MBLNU13_g11143t1 [Cladosporium sp. NU13]